MSDSLRSRRLYSPWNSPGQNTGVGRLSLLQGIFPTQGSNPGAPQCRWILYQLSHRGIWKLSCLFNENCTPFVLYLILELRSLVFDFLIVLSPPFFSQKGELYRQKKLICYTRQIRFVFLLHWPQISPKLLVTRQVLHLKYSILFQGMIHL